MVFIFLFVQAMDQLTKWSFFHRSDPTLEQISLNLL